MKTRSARSSATAKPTALTAQFAKMAISAMQLQQQHGDESDEYDIDSSSDVNEYGHEDDGSNRDNDSSSDSMGDSDSDAASTASSQFIVNTTSQNHASSSATLTSASTSSLLLSQSDTARAAIEEINRAHSKKVRGLMETIKRFGEEVKQQRKESCDNYRVKMIKNLRAQLREHMAITEALISKVLSMRMMNQEQINSLYDECLSQPRLARPTQPVKLKKDIIILKHQLKETKEANKELHRKLNDLGKSNNVFHLRKSSNDVLLQSLNSETRSNQFIATSPTQSKVEFLESQIETLKAELQAQQTANELCREYFKEMQQTKSSNVESAKIKKLEQEIALLKSKQPNHVKLQESEVAREEQLRIIQMLKKQLVENEELNNSRLRMIDGLKLKLSKMKRENTKLHVIQASSATKEKEKKNSTKESSSYKLKNTVIQNFQASTNIFKAAATDREKKERVLASLFGSEQKHQLPKQKFKSVNPGSVSRMESSRPVTTTTTSNNNMASLATLLSNNEGVQQIVRDANKNERQNHLADTYSSDSSDSYSD